MRPLGTSFFLMNLKVFFALSWFSFWLVILPSSSPTTFRQVSMLLPTNKVSIVSFLTCLLYIWKVCINFNKWRATRWCAYWVRKLLPILHGKQRGWCWIWRGAPCFSLVGIIWDIFLLLYNFLIHGFENIFELGDGECFTFRSGVGAAIGVCTLWGCTTGASLRDGASRFAMIGGDGY